MNVPGFVDELYEKIRWIDDQWYVLGLGMLLGRKSELPPIPAWAYQARLPRFVAIYNGEIARRAELER